MIHIVSCRILESLFVRVTPLTNTLLLMDPLYQRIIELHVILTEQLVKVHFQTIELPEPTLMLKFFLYRDPVNANQHISIRTTE